MEKLIDFPLLHNDQLDLLDLDVGDFVHCWMRETKECFFLAPVAPFAGAEGSFLLAKFQFSSASSELYSI